MIWFAVLCGGMAVPYGGGEDGGRPMGVPTGAEMELDSGRQIAAPTGAGVKGGRSVIAPTGAEMEAGGGRQTAAPTGAGGSLGVRRGNWLVGGVMTPPYRVWGWENRIYKLFTESSLTVM